MDGCMSVLFLLSLLFVGLTAERRFIDFQPGYEYVYSFSGYTDVKELGKFLVNAKVGYTNIGQRSEGQELLLKVHHFIFSSAKDSNIRGAELDYSKWFSFIISGNGRVVQVFHTVGEDAEVVATKKGFAALFASRLHDKDEVPGLVKDDIFTYNVTENGQEGEHNATYTVSKSDTGLKFQKIRHKHPVSNARATYLKNLYYHDSLKTLHKIEISEDFKSPKSPPGFDPYFGMRKVPSANDIGITATPEMSYTSQTELTFLVREQMKERWKRPVISLVSDGLEIRQIEEKLEMYKNFSKVKEDMYGNITCLLHHKDATIFGKCFQNLVRILKQLSPDNLSKVAEQHFINYNKQTELGKEVSGYILDAFGVIGSKATQNLMALKIIRTRNPSEDLIKRMAIHIIAKAEAPSELLLRSLEGVVFRAERNPELFYKGEVHSRLVLTLGSVCQKLKRQGQVERAQRIINRLHDQLGVHDPWKYRMKRSLMTEEQQTLYDQGRVLVLEALGNAGLDHSYHYIVSHINSTNSPWVKRAACHALRKYEQKQARK
uniref:Uncharacterized protein LOC111132336 n=1 Tax=Crassostrea virginica TaxID=6565 RepID=A0A8B8E8Q5_CRAVI|nr:uncharacterized protein LOC111132336 [Crassostrea virginica]